MPRRTLDPLPSAAFHILLALADQDLHGYGIMQRVSEDTNGKIKLGPGTLYGSIKTLLEEGLIQEMRTRAPIPGEERRRYYRLAPAGRKLARAEAERLAGLLRVAKSRQILKGNHV